jgi:hypothetical protein
LQPKFGQIASKSSGDFNVKNIVDKIIDKMVRNSDSDDRRAADVAASIIRSHVSASDREKTGL